MAQVESRSRATSDPAARKEVLGRIEKEGIEAVLLWFTDLEGHLKSFAVTPPELEDALDDGMGFDGSSITGFNAIEESDMVAIPDPTTFQLMPYSEGDRSKVARMICDIVTPDGNPYEGDPRYVLRCAIERMGSPVEYAHHEVGPSQHEIDIRFADALNMADYMITYRLIVKEIAAKNGVYATFMPKPIFGENGSGMHTHQSLFTGGRNAFFDGDDGWHLSDAGKAFIAGQLRQDRKST